MVSLGERILDLLKRHPGLSDREITDALFQPASAQQPVNGACRRLAAKGMLVREPRSDGILGNFSGEKARERSAGSPASSANAVDEPLDPLSEDGIKRSLKAWLESDGWRTDIAWKKSQGIDIIASTDSESWIIEVKGRGSRSAMRVNFFLNVLGELLQRMSDPRARYSIALPDLRQYRRLWDRLPDVAKARMTLTALFVNEKGAVYETESSKPAFASVMGADELFVQRTALGLIELDQNRYSQVEDLKRRLGDV